MSKIVVGWQLDGDLDEGRIRRAISQIKARYQPLFQDRLEHTGVWRRRQGLLHFDVARAGDPWLDQDDERLVCVTGTPSVTSDASDLRGAPLTATALHGHLLTSGGTVDRRVLHHINPPFTLCAFDADRHALTIVHDGLGADQFFIANAGRGIVFSNKCWPILLLTGEVPRIDVEAWRYWFSLGWFPGSTTPFANLRYLDRGEIVRADGHATSFEREDTLRSWIAPPPDARTVDALMPRALASVRRIVLSGVQPPAPYSADLTGGHDSRAICAVLIKEGIPCTFFTGGAPGSPDVIVAKRIARRFNLDWHHVDAPAVTGARAEALLDRQFRKLVLWGEGLAEPNRLAHFGDGPAATEAGAYLSGGSSEISKAFGYAHLVKGRQERPDDVRIALTFQEGRIDQCLREEDAREVRKRMWQQVRLGETYDIAGVSVLNFFYLTERVRRWQAAHLAVNLFDGTVLPFINVEHMQLAFAMPASDRAMQAFQSFVIGQSVEELLKVPFAEHVLVRLSSRLRQAAGRLRHHSPSMRSALGGGSMPGIVERMFADETPLWEILDRQKAVARWGCFTQGSDDEIPFLLGLLSFRYWHAMYIEPLADNDPLAG